MPEGAVEARGHRPPPALLGPIIVIMLIVLGWGLKASYVVSMPLAFSIFVLMLLHPVAAKVNARLPRKWHGLGAAAAMLVFILVLALFVGAIWLSIELAADKAPQYQDKLSSYYDSALSWMRSHNIPTPESWAESGSLAEHGVQWAARAIKGAVGVTALLVLVFFAVLLLLLELSDWRRSLQGGYGAGPRQRVVDIAGVVAMKLRRYLLIRTVVSMISGVAAGLWLFALGVDFAFVWGFLTFLLNYIPNVGSIISAILPSLMALVQFGFARAAIVIIGLTAIEQVIGQFLDPRLQGRALHASPFMVLAFIVLWGYIWGVVGAILGVPILITLIVIFGYFEPLKPIALLFSGQPTMHQLDEDVHNSGT